MYVGRIVSVGKNRDGRVCGLYRVSSRSFPNRRGVVRGGCAAIIPKVGFENDIHKNPYIAYNCLRTVGEMLVISNGSHTDILADKLSIGMPPRDTLISTLFAMDYEHDALNTPRIAGMVDRATGDAWLGIVTDRTLLVRHIALAPGQAAYVATYEQTDPGAHRDDEFDAATPESACSYILGQGVFAALERPVTAVCGVSDGQGGYDLAARESDLAA